MTSVEDILEHHGVKGMKWGVRRDNPSGGSVHQRSMQNLRAQGDKVRTAIAENKSSDVTVRTPPGGGVKTRGGAARTAHEDAIRVRTSQQIAKKSTLDSLSTKDLQELVTRMNLEQQYKTLAGKEQRMGAGANFAKKMLDEHGDTAIPNLVKKTPFKGAAPIIGAILKSRSKNNQGGGKKKKNN